MKKQKKQQVKKHKNKHNMHVNFSQSLNLESSLPAVFVIDLTQPINLPLPPSTTAELDFAQNLLNPEYFLLCRKTARTLIAHYSGLPATTLEIIKSATGALEILPSGDLHISLSHRGSLTAIALSKNPIGVDLEIADNTINIPWSVLHPFERTRIERAETQSRMDIFYQIWTKKEACVKALGLGFSIPPESFCLLPEQASTMLKKKNIQLDYKMLELSPNKTIHVSLAQAIPLLRLI